MQNDGKKTNPSRQSTETSTNGNVADERPSPELELRYQVTLLQYYLEQKTQELAVAHQHVTQLEEALIGKDEAIWELKEILENAKLNQNHMSNSSSFINGQEAEARLLGILQGKNQTIQELTEKLEQVEGGLRGLIKEKGEKEKEIANDKALLRKLGEEMLQLQQLAMQTQSMARLLLENNQPTSVAEGQKLINLLFLSFMILF